MQHLKIALEFGFYCLDMKLYTELRIVRVLNEKLYLLRVPKNKINNLNVTRFGDCVCGVLKETKYLYRPIAKSVLIMFEEK